MGSSFLADDAAVLELQLAIAAPGEAGIVGDQQQTPTRAANVPRTGSR